MNSAKTANGALPRYSPEPMVIISPHLRSPASPAISHSSDYHREELKNPRGKGLFSPLGAKPDPDNPFHLHATKGNLNKAPKKAAPPKVVRVIEAKDGIMHLADEDPILDTNPFKLAQTIKGKSMRTLLRFGNFGLSVLLMATVLLTLGYHSNLSSLSSKEKIEELLIALCSICFIFHLALHEMALVYSSYPLRQGCTNWNDIAAFLAQYFAFMFHPLGKSLYIFMISGLLLGLTQWILLYIAICVTWIWSFLLLVIYLKWPERIRGIDVREGLPVVSILYINSLHKKKYLGQLYMPRKHGPTQYDAWTSNPTKISRFNASARQQVIDANSWFSRAAPSLKGNRKKSTSKKKLRVRGNRR